MTTASRRALRRDWSGALVIPLAVLNIVLQLRAENGSAALAWGVVAIVAVTSWTKELQRVYQDDRYRDLTRDLQSVLNAWEDHGPEGRRRPGNAEGTVTR